ncbi:Nuclear cap-binding protein subunit 1 [Neolecta irregularis DAH-3]|uniref:Nuclear cap-binding protein subunit 1 n=1 Tax=Neolecta irregularis (strain DAH-3) TaxID=1198029 RepID=A0A1U7LIB6_NEOID|nr:Nuclear cap-binding protein subunit 1 [Neolecta irregularis DAH-3]|eukprot:OLL22271.1 Nuclear cap-binding protein subunit 1 [Neolecta irregularis DAH-3]
MFSPKLASFARKLSFGGETICVGSRKNITRTSSFEKNRWVNIVPQENAIEANNDDDGRDRDSYRRPRISHAEETLKRIKRDFMCIADPRNKVRLDDDIAYVAKALAGDFSQNDIKAGFLSHLRSCVLEHPYKTPHFAAVIALANSREESIGKEILEYLIIATQAYLEQGQWRNVKLMLRFLACLSCMIEGEGIIEILEGLVSAVESSTTDGYADELSRIVLLTLPFIVVESADISLKGMLDGIVDRLGPYLNKRTVDLRLITLYDASSAPYEQIDANPRTALEADPESQKI